MPFVKIDARKEKVENVPQELSKEFDDEYECRKIIKDAITIRKEIGLTQTDIAIKSGLTQQMISRIETLEHIPSLINFIKYIKAIDCCLLISNQIH